MNTRTKAISIIAVPVLLATTAWLYAGPLNPPAGPITSTGKTLTEVEPRIAISATNTPGNAASVFRITQPGSYYLTANVTGVANKHGIEISSSGVTLDLNGFEVIGTGAAGGAFDGVHVLGGYKNTTVRNGHVRNWGDDGVEISNVVNSNGARVEHVQSTGNTGNGISCSTNNGVVLHCQASDNGGLGITATRLISDCSASDNTGGGLSIAQGTIVNSTATSNDGVGINSGFVSTIINCTAVYNVGHGIEVSNGSTVTNCSAGGNQGTGIFAFSNIIIRNCNTTDNTLNGIDVSTDCLVEGCVASGNTLDGIECGSSSVIRANNCRSNGSGTEVGAGISAVGNDARIEGNNCSSNDYGVQVTGAENIIIRNTCGNNGTQNFSFAANNIYGTIADRTAPATPIVSGSAAAGTMGSTDPNANFAN